MTEGDQNIRFGCCSRQMNALIAGHVLMNIQTVTRISSFAANVALGVIAICFVLILFKKQPEPSDRIRNPIPPALGSSVPMEGIDVSSANALLIAIQPGCHFCDEEQPFYQKVLAAATKSKTRVYFLMPDRPGLDPSYVKRNHLPASFVHLVDFPKFQISATPTIFYIDGEHKIRNYWIGKLAPDRESAVIAALGQ